ncbi:hypothetical protein MCOR02_008255 [Pyricularia oryzae]|uniref:Uncharacterized protein n=1 Tax=Pyricularia oryzae TaxID=318829 RepID=A0A4P7NHB5_PYROR|nr:hypothetical protein MCOR02_008255 [Pyricularia oryzae]KAI6256949.1 hypothetical protein MCOR19_006590 [Pyricularia oryzae]KAI6343680.1 hypothetical protein MCOR30_001354 [Pyricularia oryzae]KAI6493667.1 hypothetical protein MCOR11_006104 [Pyricularia oryzae]KAI6549729.1 hypothetical protein MCOR03_009883 [Pyricularia oryzae]
MCASSRRSAYVWRWPVEYLSDIQAFINTLCSNDKEWLEKKWMRPDYEVWLKGGIDWVRGMTAGLSAQRYEMGVLTADGKFRDGE